VPVNISWRLMADRNCQVLPAHLLALFLCPRINPLENPPLSSICGHLKPPGNRYTFARLRRSSDNPAKSCRPDDHAAETDFLHLRSAGQLLIGSQRTPPARQKCPALCTFSITFGLLIRLLLTLTLTICCDFS